MRRSSRTAFPDDQYATSRTRRGKRRSRLRGICGERTACCRASRRTPTSRSPRDSSPRWASTTCAESCRRTGRRSRASPRFAAGRAALPARRLPGRRRAAEGRTQKRVFTNEEPTAGYGTLKLFAAYSFQAGGVTNTRRASRQRHERAASKPPVADKGRGAGDGAERGSSTAWDSRTAPGSGSRCQLAPRGW